MLETLLTLCVIGLIGYLIITYVPMIAPVKTVVTIAFAFIAVWYLLKILGISF